jgi:hypothetical protein
VLQSQTDDPGIRLRRQSPERNPHGQRVRVLRSLCRFVGQTQVAWRAVRKLLALAKAPGKLDRVFVWESFVTAKESPNDVDLLLLMRPDFEVEEAPCQSRRIFEHASARVAFQADVFWSRSSIGEETLQLWLETYQHTRDFKRRGIIELVLS